MSFIGDMFGGNTRQVGTQVTRTEPPEYAKPYLEFALSEARDLYDTPSEYYGGDTFVPFSDITTEALGGIADRARAGSTLTDSAQDLTAGIMAGNFANPAGNMLQGAASGDLTNAAMGYVDPIAGGDFSNSAYNMLLDTASGNFLSGNNPYLEDALAPVRDQVQTLFSRGGRLGSGANIDAMTRALAPTYADNFERERARQIDAIKTLGGAQSSAQQMLGTYSASDLNRQLNALNNFADVNQTDLANQFRGAMFAPELAAIDYNNLNNLLTVGDAFDRKEGEKLAADIARFNFFEAEPQERLANYLAAVGGGTMGGTKTAPIFGNPTGQAIGNISNLAQAAYLGSKII